MSKGSGTTRSVNSSTAHSSMANELIQAVKESYRKAESESKAEIIALQGNLLTQKKETEAKIQKIQAQIQERKETLKVYAEQNKTQIQRAKERIKDPSEQAEWINASKDSFQKSKDQINGQITELNGQIKRLKQENLNVAKKIQGQIADRKAYISTSLEYRNKQIQKIRSKSKR